MASFDSSEYEAWLTYQKSADLLFAFDWSKMWGGGGEEGLLYLFWKSFFSKMLRQGDTKTNLNSVAQTTTGASIEKTFEYLNVNCLLSLDVHKWKELLEERGVERCVT